MFLMPYARASGRGRTHRGDDGFLDAGDVVVPRTQHVRLVRLPSCVLHVRVRVCVRVCVCVCVCVCLSGSASVCTCGRGSAGVEWWSGGGGGSDGGCSGVLTCMYVFEDISLMSAPAAKALSLPVTTIAPGACESVYALLVCVCA